MARNYHHSAPLKQRKPTHLGKGPLGWRGPGGRAGRTGYWERTGGAKGGWRVPRIPYLRVWHFQRTNLIEVILEKNPNQHTDRYSKIRQQQQQTCLWVLRQPWRRSGGLHQGQALLLVLPLYFLVIVKRPVPCPFLSGPRDPSGYHHNKRWLEHLQSATEVRTLPPAQVLVYHTF